MRPSGSGVPLVVDTSAWAHHRDPEALPVWSTANELGLLVSCPVATLEIIRTARNEEEFEMLDEHFSSLPQAPVTESVCRAVLTACRELAGRRHLPVADYLIAAAAAERGFGVIHADRHFDLLATVLPFESVRLPE
jgi:predicted nucleic acid-binding protein